VSPLASRALALALLVALLGALAGAVALPAWRLYREDGRALAERRERIARLAALAGDLEPRRRQLAGLEARLARSPYLLPEASSALAAAALQERVKAAVEGSDGKLVSSQTLRPRAGEEGIEEIGLNVRLQTTTEGLRAILHALEGGRPYVVVDRLVVVRARRPTLRQRLRARRPPPARPPLDVSFTLYGLRRAAAPAGGSDG